MNGRKGTLEVPPNIHPVFAEPAIVMHVKTSLFSSEEPHLCVKPPLYPKTDFSSTSKFPFFSSSKDCALEEVQVDHEVTNKIKEITTYSGKFDRLIINESFNNKFKTTKVLAREFEYQIPMLGEKAYQIHPFLLQVATYENNKSDAGIVIKKEGYMYKDDLVQANESFKKFNGDIFNHEPTMNDIQQAGLGSCFLLSSIAAILNRQEGADFIMGMMKQQDDDSTIVRFYDPRTFEPVYVRVNNSFHTLNNKSTVDHKEPWIHILEKAYAGFAFMENFNESSKKYEIKITHQSFLEMYSLGGFSDLALKILTGKEAIFKKIQEPIFNPFKMQDFDMAKSAYLSYERILKMDDLEAQERKKILVTDHEDSQLFISLNFNIELYAMFGKYIFELETSNQTAYKELRKIGHAEFPKNIDETILFLDKLNALKLIHLNNFPDRSIDELRKNLFTGKFTNDERFIFFYPGRPGSGCYTKYQQTIFEELHEQFRQSKLLTAGTRPLSDKVDGLVPRHFYTILNVYEKEINNTPLLMVRLRNPWGRMGRVYDFQRERDFYQEGKNNCGIENKDAAEFDLDICEFTRYFENFDVGNFPSIEVSEKNEQDVSSISDDALIYPKCTHSRFFTTKPQPSLQSLQASKLKFL